MIKRPAFWARRTHKWIALVIAVQALLWMASGLYMTAISIDTIHGDHLVRETRQPLVPNHAWIDADTLARAFPDMHSFRLKQWQGRAVYEVHGGDAVTLVDAVSGDRLSPLDELATRKLAASMYIGSAPIQSARLLPESPAEVSTRPAPLWRVEFADSRQTAFYFSPTTGELLAKRHDLWRWFDFMWMLHIMDYAERSDVNNTLLRVSSVIGLAFSISGIWLLFYSFRRRRRA